MNIFLFYSNKCATCIKLINILIGEQLLEMFKIINIDNTDFKKLYKLGITGVPTITITENGKQEIFSKSEACKWINRIISNKREFRMKHVDEQRRLIRDENLKARREAGLFEYQQMELEGLSDLYAYFNTDQSKELDVPQPKLFLPYKDIGNDRIVTFSDSTPNNKITGTKILNDTKTKRIQQEKELSSLVEKEVINNVLDKCGRI